MVIKFIDNAINNILIMQIFERNNTRNYFFNDKLGNDVLI